MEPAIPTTSPLGDLSRESPYPQPPADAARLLTAAEADSSLEKQSDECMYQMYFPLASLDPEFMASYRPPSWLERHSTSSPRFLSTSSVPSFDPPSMIMCWMPTFL